MELHRPRSKWPFFFLLGGLVLVWSSLNGSELRILVFPVGSLPLLGFGLVMAAGALYALVRSFRGAPVRIDEAGLRLKVAGINRSVPWAAIEALIIEPYTGTLAGNGAPRLVLVPAPGADLGVAAEYQNKIDGRPSIILLSLDSILESLEQVKLGLSTYAGARFIDGVPVIEATAGTS